MSYNIGDIVEVRTLFGPQKGEILGYYTTKADEIKLYAINIGDPNLKNNVQHFNETQIIGLYRDYVDDRLISCIKPKGLVSVKELAKSCGININYDNYINYPFSTPLLTSIKKVIFNKPATIVLWEDGTKTVIKASKIKTVHMSKEIYNIATVSDMISELNLKPGQYYKTTFDDRSFTYIIDVYDGFDPEKGLAMAIAKKALGNKGNYYNEFKKWLPKED